MTKRLFIINPISGGKNKDFVPALIHKILGEEGNEIAITNQPGHATELTLEGLGQGITQFVAVGGDGNINEIAKVLIQTQATLGILPFGSGNGLARHNHIPMDTEQALKVLAKGNVITIDTCRLNEFVFVNMAGVGFDAHIGSLFSDAKNRKRGFATYIKTAINEFRSYQPIDYHLKYNDTEVDRKAFLVSFANSSQYGNNAYIAPHADMRDGLLDVCIMKKIQLGGLLPIGIRLFSKTIDRSGYVDIVKTSNLQLTRPEAGVIHVDGEPFYTGKEISVSVVPKSLHLIVP